MRNIAFVLVALLCALAFTSCQKNGEYKPKNKISAIWFSSETVSIVNGVERPIKVDKYQREEWVWEGKNLQSKTVFLPSKDVRSNYQYEYNKNNKIVGITSNIPTERKNRIRFIYDDETRLLKEIKYFTEAFPDNSLPYKWLVFTYDGKKVATITETINTQRYPRNANADFSLLHCFVSDEMAESIESDEMMMPKIEYDVVENKYTFEWHKKDISSITINTKSGENSYESRISYTYDSDKNPQHGRVVDLIENDIINNLTYPKNNAVSCTYESPTKTYTEESQYTYDKKVPVEKIVTREEKTEYSTRKVTEIWTYEYVD